MEATLAMIRWNLEVTTTGRGDVGGGVGGT